MTRMMKKLMKPFVLAVAAMAALSACNKEADVTPEENVKDIVLNFVSEKPDLIDPETRTVYNPTSGSIDWSAGDQIKVGITVDDVWMAAAGAPGEGESAKLFTSTELATGGATGVFKVPTGFTVAAQGTYKFYGLYPASAVTSNDAGYIPSVTFNIPDTQVPTAASFDTAADILVAVSDEYEGIPSDRNIDLAWTRVVAHGDITLKKLPASVANETIQGLTISAQEGADLVGRHYIDITTGAVTLPSSATAVNEIGIDTRNLTRNTTDNTFEFWFSSLPFTATSLKVVLTTNKKVYTKEYMGINLAFLANRRNTLSISMKGATVVEKSQLIADGEYVVSYDPENKMMGVGSESDYREGLSLDYEHPADEAIWTITYDEANDAYRIYNSEVGLYLFGATGNQSDERNLELHESSYSSSALTDLFKITESTKVSGTYNIVPLGNIVRTLGYNRRSPYCFALYKGSVDQFFDLSLHSVSFDTTPRIEVVNTSVNMAKSAITEARTINTIKRKYYDGAITATSSADWVVVSNLAAGETEVKATIAANTGEQRQATVTLSATGIESQTFTVVQATGASSVTDVIDRPLTGVSGTGYSTWSGKTSNSSAVYAGKTAGGNGAVQFKNGEYTGIVTTASGGNVKTIVVTWNSNTGSGRSLDIYGKSTAYEGPADLFDNSKQGTKIGSIARNATTLEVTGDYEYFGIRAISGAVYLDQIEITWGDAKQEAQISWSAETAEATLSNSGTSFNAPTLNGASGLDITYQSTVPAVASVDANNGTVTPLAAGTTEIKAIFEGDDAYKPKTVSYTLTVVDNRTFTITVNQPAQGGTISVSPSSAQKAGTVITLTANPATGYQLAEWTVTTATGSVSVANNQFTMPAANVTVTASFAEEGGKPAVNTVMWSETWTGSTTATSANASATPSANYGHGTTVYNGGSVVYSQSANSVYVRNENLAEGDKPELMLTSGQTWTISDIPTGGVSELSLTYKSNNTKSSVTCSTSGSSISGSSKSYTISTGGASTITLVFTCSGNTRIDDVSVTVKTL